MREPVSRIRFSSIAKVAAFGASFAGCSQDLPSLDPPSPANGEGLRKQAAAPTMPAEPHTAAGTMPPNPHDVASARNLDATRALNESPMIDDLEIRPSKFMTCESTITVRARDANGGDLAYAWSVESAPARARASVQWSGNRATFVSDVVGHYALRVVVLDGAGQDTWLTFPVHVSACDAAPGLSVPGA